MATKQVYCDWCGGEGVHVWEQEDEDDVDFSPCDHCDGNGVLEVETDDE